MTIVNTSYLGAKIITVIDTNVWISAHLFGGLPKRAVSKAFEEGLICMSFYGFEELHKTLRKSKLQNQLSKLHMSTEEVLQKIARSVAFIDDTNGIEFHVEDLRDPDDSKILYAATVVDAGYILTGDQDLLVLNPYHNIKILTPELYLNPEIR